MRRLDIARRVLEDIRPCALEYARETSGEPCCVVSWSNPFSARLYPDKPDGLVRHEGIEDAKRVAPAAHACDDRIGEPASASEALFARFCPNHRLEFTDHQWIGMWAQHRPEQVIRVASVRDPVAHRLVDRIFERPAASLDGAYLRAEQPHAINIRRLPTHVLGAI
jgi:hypothetical protein